MQEHTLNLVPFQPAFSQTRPVVFGNQDYLDFRLLLDRTDDLIEKARLEQQVIQYAFDAAERDKQQTAARKCCPVRALSTKDKARIQRYACLALRCNIGRRLTGQSFRDFSVRIAESELWQVFCGVQTFPVIRVPSKSALERFDKMIPEKIIRALCDQAIRMAAIPADDEAVQPLNLVTEIDLSGLWIDLTCVKTDIHFPVDWVLLRDAVRSLMKSVIVIRRHGLKSRIDEPADFIRQINRLSMEMTQCRRRPDSVRRRKQVLRRMKRLTKIVTEHGRRYQALLAKNWPKTDLGEKTAIQILKRMDRILRQVPAAIKQAHERIIGERQIDNADKILSFYEPDTRVIVRGKAGASVEFGNSLLLAEQAEGLIVDWKLFQDTAPADSKTIRPCVERYHAAYGRYPEAVVGDRGCDSPDNREYFMDHGIDNAICPLSPRELARRQKDPKFNKLQKRRAQTEARIGIFKNDFLGRPLLSKGHVYRELSVGWSVLAHNLWVLARLPQVQKATAAA